MSPHDPEGPPEEVLHAQRAVTDATAAVQAAAGRRVPGPELLRVRDKLREAEARLHDARRKILEVETHLAAASPSEAPEAPKARRAP